MGRCASKVIVTDAEFKKQIYSYYKKHGRHDLPWRKTADPYRILVSEIMLQQTQVGRVIPKYQAFLKAFPTAKKLAQATNTEVLGLWRGLGYNRRAINLKRACEVITSLYKGVFPKTKVDLEELPGVGPYTAGAVSAFAYNLPEVCIETNIRAVYIHFFFPTQKKVDDAALLPIITRTLDTKNPRIWYWALMDYGAMLKSTRTNPGRKSKQHTTQSKFKGSVREVRGDILRTLLAKKKATRKQLQKEFEDERFLKAVNGLLKDSLIVKKGNSYTLA